MLPVNTDVLKAVSTLTIKVRRVVEGLQGGGHASLHQGASIEFAEHKKYYPGDDIRLIDWKALARTGRYFIKTHEREVTLRCLMLIDCSPSMSFKGTRASMSKLEYAKILLGSMAHILVRQGDAVGLLAFDQSPFMYFPPKSKPEHLPALLSQLTELTPAKSGPTKLVPALRQAADRVGRRAMVVVASDMWSAGKDADIALASLSARGHDVALFHILSPDEHDLPYEREMTFYGMEDEGKVSVDVALIRQDYREAVRKKIELMRQASGKAGIDMIDANTSYAPEVVLANFAARRHRLGKIR